MPSLRNLTCVKTKTLLLLSLGCAIAILGAGIGLVFRIGSSGDTSTPSEYGVTAEVGDLQVVLTNSERSGNRQYIDVDVWGVNEETVVDSFVVISGGDQISAEPSNCASSVEVQQSCEIVFVLATDAAGPAVLLVTRGEERARWVLAGSEDAIP